MTTTGRPAAGAAPWFARPGADAPWRPDASLLAESRLATFIASTGLPDLEDLQSRAVADPGWFWGAAVADLGLHWQREPRSALDLSDGVPFARWWPGAAFNHAVAATAGRAASHPGDEALAWEGEDGTLRRLSFAELDRAVVDAAAMLAERGVGRGTRVGVFLPMLVETVVTVLALGRLEAVFTPIFSGYVAPAVAARLRAFEATHMVTADGFLRRGRPVTMLTTAVEAAASCPTVAYIVVVSRLGPAATPEPDRGSFGGRIGWWPGRDRPGPGSDGSDAAGDASGGVPSPTRTDPETPYMVIYTSGTTGTPKGTVHVHGGFPVKAAADLAHAFDLRAGDALFWFTDLGWMMGPWAISGSLLLGARLVLYEGAPDYPDPGRLWGIAARHRVTHLGVSPTLVRALLVHGTAPVRDHDLSALRILGSTGEPWNAGPWEWFFETVGSRRLPIVNYTGGTEVSGGILAASPLRPIRAASFNGPCPGMAADVVDAGGTSVADAVGELVLRAPWPGMTRGFWGGTTADRERYLETYWRRLPGTWVHGDWAIRDRDGFWYVHGRSDDTLKVAGKRVGPAEVEAAAVSHPAVVEAAAIGVPDELKGEAVVVLCVVRPGSGAAATASAEETKELSREVSDRIVEDLGKPLRPAEVAVVADLPRTRSGKIMRRVARAAWLGLDPGDLSALENPAAVASIAARGPAGRDEA